MGGRSRGGASRVKNGQLPVRQSFVFEANAAVLCSENDYSSVVTAVRKTFQDAIPEASRLFLQIKNENWGGEFTDLSELDDIPDHSVVRIVVEQSLPKVSLENS